MFKSVFTALFIAALFGLSTAAHAEIYKWVDEHGNTHFTDSPPAEKKVESVKLGRINTYTSPKLEPIKFEASTQPKTGNRHVVMYSTTWCGVCKRAKQYFNKNNIAYTEYDVENDEKGRQDFANLGARGVPVILVGNQRLNGFNRASFEKIYYH